MKILRPLGFGIGAAVLFAFVAALLLRIMPQPLRPVDFLVTGAIATMVALLALFGALIGTSKQRNIFFKKRRPPNS